MKSKSSMVKACACCRGCCRCRPISSHSPAMWGLCRERPSGANSPAISKPLVTNPGADRLFGSDLWEAALEKYAGATHLTVRLFDADERAVFGPVHSTPLFRLFDQTGYDPGIFAECAHRCITQTEKRPAVIVSQFHGLAVVGASLALQGRIVGAAVGGYAFADFSRVSEIQRLARQAGITFERLWEIARKQPPVPQRRLMVHGELLQVLGDALLREHYRACQYE